MIDSNVVIGYLDKKLPDTAMKSMDSIIDETPHISIITKIEVLIHKTEVAIRKICYVRLYFAKS